MHRISRLGRHTLMAGVALVVASCGGGDPEPTAKTAAPATREHALALPAGITIPADAATKGMFGSLQN